MRKTRQRGNADEAYRRGSALVREQRYDEAVKELRRAEEGYRQLDVIGRPFNLTLENGISGLANTLYLLGRCHLRRGNLTAAIEALETSMINARFERTIPFRSFRKATEEELAECYTRILSGPEARRVPPVEPLPSLDISHRFPFSLPPDIIPAARLYELAPERFPQYRTFYNAARTKDTALRRAGRKADDATMRTISIGVWSVLVAIWCAYGIVVLRSLVHH